MEDRKLFVRSVRPLNGDCFRLTLETDGAGDPLGFTRPGQFLNIRIPGKFLRRPFSVMDYSEDAVTILFRAVGAGTECLAHAEPGSAFDCLLPLGNGYDPAPGAAAAHPVVIGGGIGLPSVFGAAKALAAAGKKPAVLLGFNGRGDVLPTEDFEALGLTPRIATVDGSVGRKGFVTELLSDVPCDYAYVCGPTPMLDAVLPLIPDGQLSLEARMGCGFGACMGCSVATAHGMKRVCKDGPVFTRSELAPGKDGK